MFPTGVAYLWLSFATRLLFNSFLPLSLPSLSLYFLPITTLGYRCFASNRSLVPPLARSFVFYSPRRHVESFHQAVTEMARPLRLAGSACL